MEQTDILVVGGGIAGLAAVARLASDGHRVTGIDAAPAEARDDLRTTAFLQPSVETLRVAGAWEAVETASAPLRVMRLVDAGGAEPVAREMADFEGVEAGHDLFGWNVPNGAMRGALLNAIAAAPHASVLHERTVTGITARLDDALARLSDGTTLRAKLVVGADGRDSLVRRSADLPVRRWHYGQKALVFVVTHEKAHDGISTEIHRTGGPLTFVPMPDRAGRPCSSIVWMCPDREASWLHGLDDAALGAELTARSLGLYGVVEIQSPRALWPMIGQIATRLAGARQVLIAEAAHVIPPIGAQGLNTSLADIEDLATCLAEARAAGRDIGEPQALARYERRALPRILTRVAGVDMLNRFAKTELQPLRDLRLAGLRTLHRIGPLRRLAVRAGMGL